MQHALQDEGAGLLEPHSALHGPECLAHTLLSAVIPRLQDDRELSSHAGATVGLAQVCMDPILRWLPAIPAAVRCCCRHADGGCETGDLSVVNQH